MLFAAMIEREWKALIQEGFAWAFPILALVTAIICFTASRVSARAPFLGVGFLLEALSGLGNRFVMRMFMRSTGNAPDYATIDLMFLTLSALHIIASILILLGIVFVFADVRRHLARASDRDDYGRPPRPREPEEDRPWRGRPDDDRDIRT